ncbi:amidohydrolase [Thermus scotoductus]|uniref:Amidohydrolase n=1 Tax=Thermus scotoductus TaxID=37636 RepID=A0A430RGW4_THESC|nr:amidohydrolase family protein [Thermus scotoductus]RTH07373.1 amidohydrolase [Thermus scotoductus]
MIEDIPLVDAHVHLPRLGELKPFWWEWYRRHGGAPLEELYDPEGRPRPEAVDAYFASEGVDWVLLLPEYSPRTVGIHPYEDLLPVVGYNPRRFRFLANLNPHLHYPLAPHLERQLEAGAVGLKLHPVHGGFAVDHPELFPAYWILQERGLPVVFHTGVSAFPGSVNAYASPEPIEALARAFPDLKIVLAHGGRGWWYGTAASLALVYPNVWIELSGLAPARLPEYYRGYDLRKLARKFIFGTDWPGVPGIRRSAQALLEPGWDRETLERVLGRNALEVYGIGV